MGPWRADQARLVRRYGYSYDVGAWCSTVEWTTNCGHAAEAAGGSRIDLLRGRCSLGTILLRGQSVLPRGWAQCVAPQMPGRSASAHDDKEVI